MTEILEKSGNFVRGKKWEPCSKERAQHNRFYINFIVILHTGMLNWINKVNVWTDLTLVPDARGPRPILHYGVYIPIHEMLNFNADVAVDSQTLCSNRPL